MNFGVLPEGFKAKSESQIFEELISEVSGNTGVSRADASTALGLLLSQVAEHLASLWNLAELLYQSYSASGATADRLDVLSELTGTLRKSASPLLTEITFVGTAESTVEAGTLVSSSVNADAVIVATDVVCTLQTVTPWVTGTAYVLGDLVRNSGKVFACRVAGTSGATGPSAESENITDGSVTWAWIGNGDGAASATATATETGAQSVLAYGFRTIVNPISGVSHCANLADATPGSDVETDAELRIRRETELAQGGSTVELAIFEALSNLPGVTSVRVFNNRQDYEVEGVGPHGVEALVSGGSNAEIADILYRECLAAGIQSYGTTSVSVLDSAQQTQTIKFSRPEEIPIYVSVTLQLDSVTFANATKKAAAEAAALAAIAGHKYSEGKNVVANALRAKALIESVGILDVTVCNIGTSPAPVSSATIAIGTRQIADLDSSRIVITSSDGGTP